MSYIRAGHELMDFEGESECYVYSDGTEVVDYGETYEDNASLAQLIINMFRRTLRADGITDEEWIDKIKEALSKKLYVKVKDERN